MAGPKPLNKSSEAAGAKAKLLRPVMVITAVVVIVLALSWALAGLLSQRAEEKLAAIDAVRAVPDNRNASLFGS